MQRNGMYSRLYICNIDLVQEVHISQNVVQLFSHRFDPIVFYVQTGKQCDFLDFFSTDFHRNLLLVSSL